MRLTKAFSNEPLVIGQYQEKLFLLERAVGASPKEQDLYLTISHDNKNFSGHREKVSLFSEKGEPEDISRCHTFRFFSNSDMLSLTYVREDEKGSRFVSVRSKDLVVFVVDSTSIPSAGGGAAVAIPPSELFPGVLYFGTHHLSVAVPDREKKLTVAAIRDVPDKDFFNGSQFLIAGMTLVGDTITVFYLSEIKEDIMMDSGLRDEKIGEERFIKVGAALFSKDKPTECFWQSDLPLFEFPVSEPGDFVPIGFVPLGKNAEKARIYGVSRNGAITSIEFGFDVVHDHRVRESVVLNRSGKNPVVAPTKNYFEAEGTFNPAAFLLAGKIHLLYRAVGGDGKSRIGYAASDDGVHFHDRLNYPVYDSALVAEFHKKPKQKREPSIFFSGGSVEGTEDPKATVIDDRVYMTYVVHNGSWPMRTALTSISVKDFLAKHWNWTEPMLMSAPDVGSKSVVILPEKINGNYYIFHRLWPNIVVDIVPELDFGDGKRWLKSRETISLRPSYWDSRKMSMGAAPIKTSAGWLAIYNAVDRRDGGKYKIGAMLLSLEDPSKVIARSRRPILEPEEWYENDGKAGVVYPGGVVEKDGLLYIYYGGGDKVSCVATIRTDVLINELLKDAEPKLAVSRVFIS